MFPQFAAIRTLLFVTPVAAAMIYAWFVKQEAAASLNKVAELGGEVASLKRDIELREAREKALRWRLQVRDDAIEQSKCKDVLQKWVKNPDLIPRPFRPFEGDLRPSFAK